MTAVSPKPSSPGSPIVEWDESAVNEYFLGLGLDGYKDVIYGKQAGLALASGLLRSDTRADITPEHGITGDVLCALDNETLVDLGMTSLGHRLNVLRNVYEIKKEQGVEMGEDDWRPQGECRSISQRGAVVPHGAKVWAHHACRALVRA